MPRSTMPRAQQASHKGGQQSSTKPGKLVLPKISTKQDSALHITHIRAGSIFEVHGVLTAAEAARFVDAVEHSGQLTHQSSRGPKYGEAFRDNDRVSVQDEAFAQHLWQASGLQRIFSNMQLPDGAHPIGLNPNIRIYRYSTGQRFGKHIDESCETGPGQYTRFTLLIYLSGGGGGNPVVGGETVFYGMVGGATASAPVQHHTCCAATSQTNGAGCCAKCYQKQARHCCTCMGTTAWSTRGRWCGGGTSMCCARMWCLVCTNAL